MQEVSTQAVIETPASTARRNEMYGVLLSDREYTFLKALFSGLPPAAAAARAGCKEPAATSRALLLRDHIQNAIAKWQDASAEQVQFSKEKLFDMLQEAYTLSIIRQDPATMVKVVDQICKISGLHQQRGNSQSGLPAHAQNLANAMESASMRSAKSSELVEMAGLDD